MNDKKIIKLPTNNYRQSLNNFLEIKDNRNFDIYKVFDYRLDNQLILKNKCHEKIFQNLLSKLTIQIYL